ncbi:MAG TPA: class I SAM-dependent methyltransferase [Dehalococcoidia bacterium]|nr:class I SAM-dependent methyltransferase [SAR202 cluster bacterium]HAA94945.1 class I SAM-dependent methyltransferase [Dehalococcoidia bacterium]
MQESHKRVQWVYGSTNNQELEERYDQWASDYDNDLATEFEWHSPQRASDVFSKYVDKAGRVLDAGAGTGLVGECLDQAGYKNLVAMDLSKGMLEEARSKNVYKEFHQMALGGTLDFATDEFDAVISVGVFTLGHAPANAFDELARITKPGGSIVFSLRTDTYETDGFKEQQDGMEKAGVWQLTEATDPFQPLPKGEPEVWHRIWVYKVN